MATDLTSDIATQAVEPMSSTVDGNSSASRSMADIIAGQQFLDAKVTQRKRRRGVVFTKLVTPGALTDEGRTGDLGGFNLPGVY